MFLVGFIPAAIMLSNIAPDEATAQAGSVGLFIYVTLLPAIVIGALLSISAILKLNSLQKINSASLNNIVGSISIFVGWVILLFTVTVIGFIAFAVLSN
ncbi:hypothetical protein [Thalassotalea agarivorans]|uniref:hypothetical protein n=1 Tax=Thalassotalea agarivorans TaxID=349064 RepID=UPI00115FB46C|nr:hypothetical protein [Thalassotalea agarivorans]